MNTCNDNLTDCAVTSEVFIKLAKNLYNKSANLLPTININIITAKSSKLDNIVSRQSLKVDHIVY